MPAPKAQVQPKPSTTKVAAAVTSAPVVAAASSSKTVEESKSAEPIYKWIEDIDSATLMVKDLSAQPAIGLKCEGTVINADGRICVIALSTPQRVYLLDCVAFKHRKFGPDSAEETSESLFENSGLKEFLQNEETIKVMHDARFDSTALYHSYGVKLTKIFDTQMAQYMKQVESGVAAPKLQGPLGDLLVQVNSIKGFNAKKLEMDKLNKTHPKLWATRPLQEKLRDYLVEETQHLLSIYHYFDQNLNQQSKGKMVILDHSQINALLPNHAKTDAPKDTKTNVNLDKLVTKTLQELVVINKRALSGK